MLDVLQRMFCYLRESDSLWTKRIKYVWVFPARFRDFPTLKTCFNIVTVRSIRCSGPSGRSCFVCSPDLSGRALTPNLAAVDPENALAEAADLIHLMADEDDRAAALGNFLHLAEAFLLEFEIADGEHFIHQQNFRFEMRRDGKGEAHLHAGAEMLERRIDEALDFGESDDLVDTLRSISRLLMPRMAPLR